jgi:hypothetical protein
MGIKNTVLTASQPQWHRTNNFTKYYDFSKIILAQLHTKGIFHAFFVSCTDKSFSEALILASTNPQYDKRLFIELQVQYMKIPSSEHGENMLCT